MGKIFLLVVVGIIIVGAILVTTNNTDENSLNPLQMENNMSGTQNNTTIATVNGKAITRLDLDAQIAQLRQNPQVQLPEEGDQEAQAQFEKTVLEQLIANKLLIISAENQGISVDENEINAEVEAVKGQFENEEAFGNQLSQMGLSEESLREDLENQLLLNQYLAFLISENNLSVSDDEVQTVYDQQIATQEGAPGFEEVKPQISAQLEQQKLQPILTTIIEETRATAEIEVLL